MKKYVIDRDKLKEILLAHKTFVSNRCRDLMAQGVDVTKLTYGDTKKITDEFIDTMIDSLPVDEILDQLDEGLKKMGLPTTKEQMEARQNDNIRS